MTQAILKDADNQFEGNHARPLDECGSECT
jgi:hypothetical protein